MNPLRTAIAMAALVGLCSTSFGALGEVALVGSTWTGRVDGVTKYSGPSMAEAEVACLNAMTSGTIVLQNSGNANGQMRTKSNVIVDGLGKTIGGGGTAGLLYAQNANNIGGKNLVWNATNWFGHRWRTCYGQNATGSRGTANQTFRFDNCSGGTGFNLTLGSPSDVGAIGSRASHNVEAVGINGGSVGTVTSTDRTGGSGLQLSGSTNFAVSGNNATRASWGGPFAGFRVSQNNGKTTLGQLNATSCGRGFHSVGSRDATISNVAINTTSFHGILLDTTTNTRVDAGTVTAGNPCKTIIGGWSNVVNVTCQ